MASYSLFDVISLKNDLPEEGLKKRNARGYCSYL